MKEFWRIGKHNSTVVSNVRTTEGDTGHNETDYYGGFLVCESIATKEYADLIASALEMKEMLNHFVNAIEGGIEQGENASITGYNQTFGIAMLREAKRIIGRND